MQEFSVPAAYVAGPDDNVTDDVFTNEAKWPDEAGLKRMLRLVAAQERRTIRHRG